MAKQGRPRAIPNPNKKSKDEPSVIVSSTEILDTYNYDNDKEAKRVSKSVQEYYTQRARDAGWDDVKFIKSTDNSFCCLLTNTRVLENT